MTKSFDFKNLHRFVGGVDRRINPFFTGRSDLLTRIDFISKNIGLEYQDNPSSNPAEGSTHVIMGAPGIGKTSLLEKIKLTCIEQLNDESTQFKIIPVMIKDPVNLSFEYLNTRIHNTIGELESDISISRVKESMRASLQAISSISAFEVGIDLNHAMENKPLVPENHVILLMIDEIQSIHADKESEVAKVLLCLHAGSNGYPILPVFAGLSNSSAVLQQIGISRFGRAVERHLEPLSLSEVKESVEKFMTYFHVKTNSDLTSEWSTRIGGWVDGWPKHVENTLAALGQELLENEGNLSAVDPHLVKLGATTYRVSYYNTRFGPFSPNPEVVGENMAEIGSVPRRGVEIKTITSKQRRVPEWTERLSESELQQLDFEFLLRYGLIDKMQDNPAPVLVCPIPSLHSYSVTQTGSELHISAYSGNLELVKMNLDHGLDINGPDAWGRTPLHIAAENNWDGVTQLLLNNGTNPQIRDNRIRLPLDLAKKGSYTHDLLNEITDPNHSPSNTKNSVNYDNDFNPSPDF